MPRHSKQIILPFPPDIDRRDFSNYLCGFSDGEGCFSACFAKRRSPRYKQIFGIRISFTIALRSDDRSILELIQSFWQAGVIYFKDVAGRYPNCRNPQYAYCINDCKSLAQVIVPFFDTYSLRAKKAGDFCIWREAVMLHWRVMQTPMRPKENGKGTYPRWTAELLAEFDSIARRLREGRDFDHASIPSHVPAPTERPTLFDQLP